MGMGVPGSGAWDAGWSHRAEGTGPRATRRGFLLSLEALVAVGLLLLTALFLTGISVTTTPELRYERLYLTAKDILNILENAKIRDTQGLETLDTLVAQGVLTDLNGTLLDAIGTLWASGNLTAARALVQEIVDETLNGTGYSYELIMGSDVIYRKNASAANVVARLSTVASGYDTGKPVSGFVSRAYLTTSSKEDRAYAFFGGYVGDGNITSLVELPNLDTVLEGQLEMDAGGNFSLYINRNFSGSYVKTATGNLTAERWTIPSSYLKYFSSGENTVQINFSAGERSFIGGGYLRVTFNTTQFNTEPNLTRYRFPGISGVINLYDSFSVPGTLQEMALFLNYTSTATLFVNIGNKTVYQGNSSPATVNNSVLSSLLNYSNLSAATIPVRVGHYILNASNVTNASDTVLTTSRVQAMNTVDIPNGSVNISRISAARELDKLFVDVALNSSRNTVGLVSYRSTVPSSTGCTGWIEPITTNKTALTCQINNYNTGPGQRCLCCAIRQGITFLDPPYTNASRRRFIVLMSDGSAGSAPYGQCPIGPSNNPNAAAVNESCDAYKNHGIQVYTIGFGVDANNTLLQQIADCGGGKWFASTNYSGLQEIYQTIAEEITNSSALFEYQQIVSTNVSSTLHPNSQISFNYTPLIGPAEFGEATFTFESKSLRNATGAALITDNVTGTKEGWFFLPPNTTLVDARLTSYSSQFWTDRAYVKSQNAPNFTRVFWLADHGPNYISLGDPFNVYLPPTLLQIGGNNSVKLGTGPDSLNATGGSPDARVIYTLRVKSLNLQGYSGVFPKAKGATVTVYEDIDGDNVFDSSTLLAYGPSPSDQFDPLNDSVDDAFLRLMDNLNLVWNANPGSPGSGSVADPYDGVNQTNPIDIPLVGEVLYDSSSVTGVRSLWGPTALTINVWI